ncbi:MAG: hypothetical protein KAY38_01380 [Acinetobacter sp.]|nr:hypothetical protein [Acinetobacter sp.]
MKKYWFPIIVISTLSVSACNKPNEQINTQAEISLPNTNLSTANYTDIKDDFHVLDDIANKHSQTVLNLQQTIAIALEKKEYDSLHSLYSLLEKFILEYNDALDSRQFKSNEAYALKEKFKKVHMLSLEMAQEMIKDSPQLDRVNTLKEQMENLQQSTIKEMRKLQRLIYAQPNVVKSDNTIVQAEQNTATTPIVNSFSNPNLSLSHDNSTDIKDDLIALRTSSTVAKQQAESSLMNMKHALDKRDMDALKISIKESKTLIQNLNNQYDAVKLKSSEATVAREKLKAVNHIQIELGDIILSPLPDRQRFELLQKELSNSKSNVDNEMRSLEIKANSASS